MTRRIEAEDIRGAIAVADYAERYLGVDLRPSGRELRGACPLCGSNSRAPFCVREDVWLCHACEARGDVLSLCQAFEEIDFPTAVGRLAAISGIEAASSPLEVEERQQRRRVRERARAEELRRAETERIAAEALAREAWTKIERLSTAGLDYLRQRGVESALGDVRFDDAGSVSLPLRQADGTVTNIVRRRIDGAELKVHGMKGCGSRGVFGDLRKMGSTEGPIVIVEGVFDWLSARVLAPNRLVLGAHGAGRLPDVVQLAAEAAGDQLASRGLVFVPHKRDHEDVGERQARKALEVARDELGVPPARIYVFDLGEAEDVCDLNDYLRARPAEDTGDPFDKVRSLAELANHRCFDLTDAGNAARFAYYHRDRLRYVAEMGQWFWWNGKVWPEATIEKNLMRGAIEVTDHIDREAVMTAKKDPETAEALRRWARTSRSKERLSAMHQVARAMPEVQADLDQIDRDLYLLAVQNGTLDLRTGELRPHRREDMITRLSQVSYEPDARCPRWDRFVKEVFEPNPDAAVFVQRYFGYSLTGNTSAQCLLFAHGSGGNGKGVLFRRLQAILGDSMAYAAPFDAFLQKRGGDAPLVALANMRGARAVVVSEFNQSDRLNEGLIKQVTGGDPVTGCFKYKNPFTYQPRFKLWMSANHLPRVRGTDDGFWRRFRLVPFEVTFAGQRRDDQLEEVLDEETPGILAWAVRGCLDWLHDGGGLRGLGVSESVSTATDELRADSDVIGRFLEDCCTTKVPDARTKSTALYEAYRQWCQDQGHQPMSNVVFGRSLSERGFAAVKSGSRYWEGIGLTTERDEQW